MSQQDNLQQEIQENKQTENNRKRYLPPEELSMFCEQVSLILSSGVALYDGVEALCDNYRGTSVYPAFERINEGVKEKGSLYEAFKGVDVFPPYLIEMTKIGEHTGKLDQVMASLSIFYLRESKIKKSIQNAVIYPMGLLAMMAIVILVLVVKVLPIFEQVYRSLGTDMSANAIAIMGFGMGVGNGVLIVAAALIALVLVVVLLLRTKLRQTLINVAGRFFPPLARIYNCIAAGRFASNMSMMLGSGYPLEETLPLIAAIFDDPAVRARIETCGDQMVSGMPFPEAIARAGLFDKLHNKMVQMGFMSGRTDHVMAKLAYIYEEELDHDIASVVALIEPSMVAMLTLIVGAILLSVMLPMVSIMSSIL